MFVGMGYTQLRCIPTGAWSQTVRQLAAHVMYGGYAVLSVNTVGVSAESKHTVQLN